jgi:hypothetical protein
MTVSLKEKEAEGFKQHFILMTVLPLMSLK